MGQRRSARLGAIPFWKLFKLRKWLPGALAAGAGLLGPVDRVVAQPAQLMPVPGVPGAITPHAPVAPPGSTTPKKTVSLNFDKMNWDEVLDWYSKESGLTLITTVKPTGSPTLKPNKDHKFTMAEVTDLINEALTQQKFILIRRHMTFFIQPADEKIDPTMLPRIELSELADRGKTEIVQVILPIEGMAVADAEEELQKLLTPFGSMVALEKQNMILIQDTVGNIDRIRATLDAVDKGHSDSLDIICKWRPAQEIAERLKTLLADKDTTTVTGAAPGGMQAFIPGGGGFGPGVGFGPGGGGFGPGGGGFGPGGGGFDPAAAASTRRRRALRRQRPPRTRVKTVQIAVDTSRNAIVVTAPQDKILLAKQIIAQQDKQLTPDQKEYKPAPPIVQTYNVTAGAAPDLAKNIQTTFPWIQAVSLAQQNQVLVIAAPIDQESVQKLLNIPEKERTTNSAPATVVIPLNYLDPTDAAAVLNKLYGVSTPSSGSSSTTPVPSGVPLIEPRTGLNPRCSSRPPKLRSTRSKGP